MQIELTIPTQSSGSGSGFAYSTVTLSPSRQMHVEMQSDGSVGGAVGVLVSSPGVCVGSETGGSVSTVGWGVVIGIGGSTGVKVTGAKVR